MPVGSLLGKLTGDRSIGRTGPSPSVDEVGLVLKNERRRMIVYAIAEADVERLKLGDVSEMIASSEFEKPPNHLNSKERKRVYIGLYQTHLPKLDKIRVVDYNQDRGTLERGPKFASMLQVLEIVADECTDGTNRGELA